MTLRQEQIRSLIHQANTGNMNLQAALGDVMVDLFTVANSLKLNPSRAAASAVATVEFGADEATTYTITVEFENVRMSPERFERHLRENVCGDCEQVHCTTPGKLKFEFTRHLADDRADALASRPGNLCEGLRSLLTSWLMRAGTPGDFNITYGPVL